MEKRKGLVQGAVDLFIARFYQTVHEDGEAFARLLSPIMKVIFRDTQEDP
jgi:hypothetical protein